jgi:hypothetical protein
MGVSGLHEWIEERKLGKRVSLRAGAGGRCVLLLDGPAGMLNFFGLESLWSDYESLRTRVRSFVDAFASVGVQLEVVFDGVVEPDKFPLWLSRRRKEVARVRKICAAMYGGQAPTDGKPVRTWLPPAFSQSYLGRAFREAGGRVTFSVVEGDRAIAGLAEALPPGTCLGVAGKDSDFCGASQRRSTGAMTCAGAC